MKKKVNIKKILSLKAIFRLLIAIMVIFIFYNLFMFFTAGKIKIRYKTNTVAYAGADLETLIFVTDENDNPIKGKVKMQLYDSDDKKVKGAKTTIKLDSEQENQVVKMPIPEELENGAYTLKIKVSKGLSNEKVETSINLVGDKKSKISISFDKGIYKPGDTVNYRALVLSNKTDAPEKQAVEVCIYDGNNNKVHIKNIETSEYGIVSGSFNIANEVNSGNYKLEVSTKSTTETKTFKVNPYITPKFETSITSDKESYIIGENAKITISGKYFFGEPVVNAEVKGKINDEEIQGLTDDQGNFVVDYNMAQAGVLDLSFEVIDNSNYSVEAKKSLNCGTNAFEIEVLSEYGEIAEGVDTDIYVITKKIDGTPVKTYSTVKIGKNTKQVISDENGIGKLTLTSAESEVLENDNDIVDIEITSEDMNKTQVSQKLEMEVESGNGTFISTDKVKYETGEDIKVSLNTTSELNNNTIYVFKNQELLKILTSDENDFTFNLEDTSGIIDIYTDSVRNKISNYTKKTIFVKPDKALNINVSTDSNEYKPGEELKISFDTKNQEGKTVDSALLVSILDEAVLQLADNDLSIDNIKLALSDIRLSEGMTAADLYTAVLDDKQDTTLASVLLKQDSGEPKIQANQEYGFLNNGIYLRTALLFAFILFVMIIIKLAIKSSNIRSACVAIIDVIAILVILAMYATDPLYYYIDSEFIVFSTNVVLAIIIYALFLYKQKDYIFGLIKDLAIWPIVYIIFMQLISLIILLISKFTSYKASNFLEDLTEFVRLALIFAVPILFAILHLKEKNKKLEKTETFLKKFTGSLLKAFAFWISVNIVADIADELAFLIVLAVYIIATKVVFTRAKSKIKDGKIVLDFSNMDIIGVISGIILILIILILFSKMTSTKKLSSRPDIIFEEQTTSSKYTENSSSSSLNNDGFSVNDITEGSMFQSSTDSITSSTDSQTTAEVTDELFDGIFTTFSKSFSETEVNDSIATNELENDDEKIEEQISENKENLEIEENIRNVFLESLAFIPELVTENGKAETNIKISDNITTWKIQTVGNTKNGELGYASTSFKVFKEFFVDFSLPENSIKTDKVSIPVSLYNYTAGPLDININVASNDWSKIGEYQKTVNVAANTTQMIYVPLELIKSGEGTLRIETKAGNVSDIVEKTLKININGLEKKEIVASGIIEDDYSQDIIFNENAINDTKKLKVKLYPSPVAQAIEGMESILKLPTGCFEQTSSSLYPDILVLKYLENNELDTPELKEKALGFIEEGYQKLLTYEVEGEKGGYSLYGDSPAEPVLTAFGLMQMKDLEEVYEIDESVIINMTKYLLDKQNVDGTFDYKSTYIGGSESKDKVAMNAYIIWALSEVDPGNSKLEKSIKYLEKELEKENDNYTLALIANVFANTDNKNIKKVIKKLNDNLYTEGQSAYITSKIIDYWGATGNYQSLQSTALFSLALSKIGENQKNNAQLINYLINSKKPNGTWGTTQSTVLALKAINEYNKNSKIENQKIIVRVGEDEKTLTIEDNTLDFYEFEFNNVQNENKVEIEMEKGKITYEVIKEYYIDYLIVEDSENEEIKLSQEIMQNAKVNDVVNQVIKIKNNYQTIENGLLQINIPQGMSVNEETLLKLLYDNKIEKYEYSYGKIDLYVRNFKFGDELNINIEYKALYPVNITGAGIRFFDYYNPEVEAILTPVKINVTN